MFFFYDSDADIPISASRFVDCRNIFNKKKHTVPYIALAAYCQVNLLWLLLGEEDTVDVKQ